jgi:glyoxylase-like metal-dependent hydrolase (beta-lactamase superfamily II)
MHPDHIGGLLGGDGAAFPNAEVSVHAAELAFWTDAAIRAQVPPEVAPFFTLAEAVAGAYAGRVRTFETGGAVMPGIATLHLPGHTPGHSGFRISGGDQSLLVWGDAVLAPELQLARPDVASGFDLDRPASVATRGRILDVAARERLRVAGMHLAFPGIGHVAAEGGGYRFVAEPREAF